jgi:hypothetical protein
MWPPVAPPFGLWLNTLVQPVPACSGAFGVRVRRSPRARRQAGRHRCNHRNTDQRFFITDPSMKFRRFEVSHREPEPCHGIRRPPQLHDQTQPLCQRILPVTDRSVDTGKRESHAPDQRLHGPRACARLLPTSNRNSVASYTSLGRAPPAFVGCARSPIRAQSAGVSTSVDRRFGPTFHGLGAERYARRRSS